MVACSVEHSVVPKVQRKVDRSDYSLVDRWAVQMVARWAVQMVD